MNEIIRANLPCVDCICLAICKNQDIPTNNLGPFLNQLGHKCDSLKRYLRLLDLGLDTRKLDYTTKISERKHVTQPLSRRIIELFEYMEWEHDLSRERIFAKGLLPAGEE